MSKLQEIENGLKAINDAVFQDLCDSFIFYTEPDCDNIHRVGSVEGKQKTGKGTPDSYYLTKSGDYVLLEYTTMSPDPKAPLLKKIREDIDKCAEVAQVIGIDKIKKITYCLNSNLDITDYNDLRDYAAKKHLAFEVLSKGTLAIGLLGSVCNLGREFLNVNINSGQVLDTTAFIAGYESSGYSTPLSNHFVGRENELSKLEEVASGTGVTILTGPAGVGKTKLVLGYFDKVKAVAPATEIFCIDNKHAPIFDDLRTYIQTEKNYIILIDDANRQVNNLKPLLGLLKERRSGMLHIIATVRDYANGHLERFVEEYKHSTIKLEKFTDEQLTEVLKSPDFEIHNQDYIKRILEIADGNARLAIMAAEVAKKTNKLQSLQDASEIYDAYYEKAIAREVFENNTLLKTLGVIAFFHSISKDHTDLYNGILQNFNLNRIDFEQSLVTLENLELVESSPDMQTYKISDQVLGTYFFYYTFFKKEVLSFETALQRYFPTHSFRLSDTVIPTNNTFGYENVYAKIDPYLAKYWQQIKEQESLALKFLDLFWLYKQEETLLFVASKITGMATVANPVFIYDEQQTNRDYAEKAPYLQLLLPFFNHSLDLTKDAFILAAQYVTKVPEQYGRLVKMLKEALIYSRQDEQNGFYRQHNFADVLREESSDCTLEIRQHLFFDVVPTLMKTSFNVTAGGRKRNVISFYRYQLPLTEQVKQLREKIWALLDLWFTVSSQKSIRFILQYIHSTPNKVKAIFVFDRPLFEKVIHAHLSHLSFIDCYVIQEYVTWSKRQKIAGDYTELQSKFLNEAYKAYLVLSFDYSLGRSSDNTRLTMEQFNQKKDKEIRKAFRLETSNQFETFYKMFCEINKGLIFLGENYPLQLSLDIVLHEAYNINKENLAYYRQIARWGNETDFIPHRLYGELSKNITEYRSFYLDIIDMEFNAQDLWLVTWFINLPEQDITKEDAEALLGALQTSKNIHYIRYDQLIKFHDILDGFGKRFLEVALHLNSQSNRWFKLYELFESYLDRFDDCLELLKKSYFQQQLKHDGFDHNYKIFYAILLKDKSFLLDYIAEWSKGHYFSLREHEGISIAWKHPEASAIIKEAMDHLSKSDHYSIREDICNVLFRGISDEKKDKAIDFLKQYILENNRDADKVDAAIDCIRHNFTDHLEPILLAFLAVQQSFDIFSKISWTRGHMMGNGKTSFGEMRAKMYQKVLDILEKIPEKSYLYANHKSHIKSHIAAQNRYAAHERKRMFLEED